MERARVVIGANFGDCGKGLLTDFFSDEFTTVVRFNGGAQAGHTVVTPNNGLRYVFSHFGAGSFRGAKTFLSRYFIANPLLFEKEAANLAQIGLAPHVVVDRDAMLTTPYDMLINQIIERWRGKERHGSCGVGIGETVYRAINTEHGLRVGDILDPRFADRLDRIRRCYLPQRIARLTNGASLQDEPLVLNENLLVNYIAACRRFVSNAEVVGGSWLSGQERIVFEGAQGLLLDENHPRFQPHVTWSRTGIANATQLAREAKIGTLDVTYVTRAYLTRHGAGPLPGESRDFVISDATNATNEFQGPLRFAPLDIELLRESVLTDVLRGSIFIDVNPSIAITHLDQVANSDQIATDVFEALDFPEGYVSYGPSRCDVISAVAVAA